MCIRDSVCAWPLDEFKAPGADSFLNPQLAHCQMARPPNPSAAADADRRATIGTYTETSGEAE
eukprot:12555180-Alexandrium_andersonii.AAC.1